MSYPERVIQGGNFVLVGEIKSDLLSASPSGLLALCGIGGHTSTKMRSGLVILFLS